MVVIIVSYARTLGHFNRSFYSHILYIICCTTVARLLYQLLHVMSHIVVVLIVNEFIFGAELTGSHFWPVTHKDPCMMTSVNVKYQTKW